MTKETMQQSLTTLLMKHTVKFRDQRCRIKNLQERLIWGNITTSQIYMQRTGFMATQHKISINLSFSRDQLNTTWPLALFRLHLQWTFRSNVSTAQKECLISDNKNVSIVNKANSSTSRQVNVNNAGVNFHSKVE